MKKISYRNRRHVPSPIVVSEDLPSVPEAEEGLSGSANKGIGRGFAMPGEPVMPAMYSEQEERPVFLNKEDNSFNKDIKNYDDLLELFVYLADSMDEQELRAHEQEWHTQDGIALANFADFLIKKVAIQKNLDYSWLFRDLLIKIVESDIFNQNEVLIELTNMFNKLLLLHVNLGKNILESKREAYQGVVAKAKEYVK